MDELKRCGFCGSVNPVEALFCMKCGVRFAAEAGAAGAGPPPAGMTAGLSPSGVQPPSGMPVAGPSPPGMYIQGPPRGTQPAGFPPPDMPPGYVARPLPNDPMAIVSLVVSMVGLISCLIFLGIPAVVFGYIARSNIRQSNGALGGDGAATAGLIIGWIEIGMMVIVLFIVVVAVISASGFLIISLW
jgi:hypothetical protein